MKFFEYYYWKMFNKYFTYFDNSSDGKMTIDSDEWKSRTSLKFHLKRREIDSLNGINYPYHSLNENDPN